MRALLLLSFILSIFPKEHELKAQDNSDNTVELMVLGNAQDAGAPQINCNKQCCENLKENNKSHQVVSLGVIDNTNNKSFLFEATPDIGLQCYNLNKGLESSTDLPDGIFLTHAHIGHYSGLMYLGKEATNANSIDVYSMPRMSDFLKNNGPWSQLINNQNILLNELQDKDTVSLSTQVKVIPFLVPHRDEYSETVGYQIIGPNKKALFIPDIDKWKRWESNIVDEIKKVDYAFLDATFYDGNEISNRDMSEIPHPFVVESMEIFQALSPKDKIKVHFIHFNHSNPLLDRESDESRNVLSEGYNIAREGLKFKL